MYTTKKSEGQVCLQNYRHQNVIYYTNQTPCASLLDGVGPVPPLKALDNQMPSAHAEVSCCGVRLLAFPSCFKMCDVPLNNGAST